MNALVRIDAWLERGEGGSVPLDLLRQRGLEIAEASTLDDGALPPKLWEEDQRIFLTYYADDEERQRWQTEFGEPLSSPEPRPFDRDRLLPTMERRLARLTNG